MASLQWLLYCIISVSSNQFCDKSHECIGESLTDPGKTQIRGYKAAYNAPTSFYGGRIQCDASFACSSMQFIKANMKILSGSIICNGREWCSNTIIQSNDSLIDCFGSTSCSFSTITTTYHSLLRCSGYRSCYNAYIHGVEDIRITGFLSLHNAIIETIGNVNDTFIIDLDASFAAFGAKLICRENHTCYIHCKSIESCYMFNTQCIGECIITIQNTPNISLSATTNLLQLYETIVPSHDEFCTIPSTNFDDYKDSQYPPNITAATDAPICCRARSSCQNVKKMRLKNDLLCDALLACTESTIIGNNGTIYCDGESSCWMSSIANAHAVYCGGYTSCRYSTISSARNIVCSGQMSCRDTTFVSNRRDITVYFVGRTSGRDVALYCNETDECIVYCYGLASCVGTVLYCTDNCAVECDAELTECPTVVHRNSTPIVDNDNTIYDTSTTRISTDGDNVINTDANGDDGEINEKTTSNENASVSQSVINLSTLDIVAIVSVSIMVIAGTAMFCVLRHKRLKLEVVLVQSGKSDNNTVHIVHHSVVQHGECDTDIQEVQVESYHIQQCIQCAECGSTVTSSIEMRNKGDTFVCVTCKRLQDDDDDDDIEKMFDSNLCDDEFVVGSSGYTPDRCVTKQMSLEVTEEGAIEPNNGDNKHRTITKMDSI